MPDVVLEVDNTTDVRRNKLMLYESWGFPEVWVEVPEEPQPSRPASLRPGLTIHLRDGSGFRPSAASLALPGWTADEIHRALNETGAVRADRRRAESRRAGAGRSRGDGDRTATRSCATTAKRAAPKAGQQDAPKAGRRHCAQARSRCSIPAAFPLSASLSERLAAMEGVSDRLVAAALACRDEEDFLRLLSAT